MTAAPGPQQPDEVPDLMAALRESVDRCRSHPRSDLPWDKQANSETRPAAPSAQPDEESASLRSQRTGECICTSTERVRNRPFSDCWAHDRNPAQPDRVTGHRADR